MDDKALYSKLNKKIKLYLKQIKLNLIIIFIILYFNLIYNLQKNNLNGDWGLGIGD